MGNSLILNGRGGGHKDFAGSGRETICELGMLTFHVDQSSRIGNFQSLVILVTDEGLSVLADGARSGERFLGMTIVLSQKGHGDEEKTVNG